MVAAATAMATGATLAVMVVVLLAHPDQVPAALILATIGNTAGGMVTYWMGRLLPQKLEPDRTALARRWGAPGLLLAWVPIIGDALCAAAGWLRLPWLPCVLWMAIGKGGRYCAVAWIA